MKKTGDKKQQASHAHNKKTANGGAPSPINSKTPLLDRGSAPYEKGESKNQNEKYVPPEINQKASAKVEDHGG